jgi:hypothetical protein
MNRKNIKMILKISIFRPVLMPIRSRRKVFGRLKDAVTGKVDVQKESTVITLTNNKTIDISQVKSKMDNTIKSMDKHYAAEVKKVQQYAIQNRRTI